MNTTVVCGLLGAGKTSFVQGIIKNGSARTVVLVNDFGKLGIDGEVISSSGVDTIELPSGCVCCTLKFDLITTIQMILNRYNPERLIIEPSGVAAVSGILEALELVKLDSIAVIGIIDTAEFLELYESGAFGSFFEDQIRNSDVLLLNKVDLCSRELIDSTREAVERMNPSALIFETIKAVINEKFNPTFGQKSADKGAGTAALNYYETHSFRLKDNITAVQIERLFKTFSSGAYGNILRAKSLISEGNRCHRIDYTFGQVVLEDFNAPVSEGRMVVIGSLLNKEALANALGIRNLLLTTH